MTRTLAIPLADARPCEQCGSEFRPYLQSVTRGEGRFCSHSCVQLYHWSRRERPENGYRSIRLPNHPLADSAGVVTEHRVALYAKIGSGTHPCHYCAKPVTWKNFRDTDRADMLVVDHLDTDKRNNDPDNLVPSCSPCNTNRNLTRPKIVGDDELFVVDKQGWRHRAAKVTCEMCGVEFLARLTVLRKGWGRFCSNLCAARWRSRQKV